MVSTRVEGAVVGGGSRGACARGERVGRRLVGRHGNTAARLGSGAMRAPDDGCQGLLLAIVQLNMFPGSATRRQQFGLSEPRRIRLHTMADKVSYSPPHKPHLGGPKL